MVNQKLTTTDMLMNRVSMRETVVMYEKGQFSSWAAFWQGGVCWTRGRLEPSVMRLLSPEKRMIPSHQPRLAQLFMISCHEEDHRRDAGDTLFRSRNYAWIVKGRVLAKKVVKDCAWCNKEAKKTLGQQMGDYPTQKFDVPCRPFTNICTDLAGAFEVKAMNDVRSKLKCYPVLFYCLNTGPVAIKVVSAYDTMAFLIQYEQHCAERGRPKFVYTDKGKNLVKVATYVQDKSEVDWGLVMANQAKLGITWRAAQAIPKWVAPVEGHHRVGLAENRVKVLKKTLVHLTGGGDLRHDEYNCVLAQAANIINDRPLGIRHQNGLEEDLVSTTPNLLMLPRTESGPHLEDNYENPDKYTRRQRDMEELLNQWWHLWYSQVFSSLFPFNKWKVEQENLMEGDVCLKKYDKKVGMADYRLCKVNEVDMDIKGLVRNVMVLMRPTDSREKSFPYKSKVLVTLEVSIQRLVLICPVEQVRNEWDNTTPPLQAAHALNAVLSISYLPHPDVPSLS